jgi:hypothetical protein
VCVCVCVCWALQLEIPNFVITRPPPHSSFLLSHKTITTAASNLLASCALCDVHWHSCSSLQNPAEKFGSFQYVRTVSTDRTVCTVGRSEIAILLSVHLLRAGELLQTVCSIANSTDAVLQRQLKLLLSVARLQTERHCRVFMEPSRSSEGACSTASQKIASSLWNPKVHDRAHKILPLVPTLSRINPLDVLPYCLNALLQFTHIIPRVSLPSRLL